MFAKESLHVAVGVVLAVLALRLVRELMPRPATRQADGSEYIPGQPRA